MAWLITALAFLAGMILGYIKGSYRVGPSSPAPSRLSEEDAARRVG